VLEQGIYPRLLACGVSSLEEYQRLMRNDNCQAERAALIDQLTVKDSKFFRSEQAMTAVGDYLRERTRKNHEQIDIWSVGCARGQEAYSLGITAAEIFAFSDVRWQVLGTDISPSAVMDAAQGNYSDKQVDGISIQRMACYFDYAHEGWQVVDQLREAVRFGISNLKDIASCPYSAFDVIYCQNVLIYFRPDMVEHILNELQSRLKPGGLLVLGAGEGSSWNSTMLNRWRPETLNAYCTG
jgi:type IV pilus assembly protein PilK